MIYYFRCWMVLAFLFCQPCSVLFHLLTWDDWPFRSLQYSFKPTVHNYRVYLKLYWKKDQLRQIFWVTFERFLETLKGFKALIFNLKPGKNYKHTSFSSVAYIRGLKGGGDSMAAPNTTLYCGERLASSMPLIINFCGAACRLIYRM